MINNQSTIGKLKGEVFLLTENQHSFAASQIALLEAIHECGSISKASKRLGISYKTAWERIEAMNNMSNQPLVTRSAGGAQGGGTALTELGRRIIDGFQALCDEHQAFIEKLGSKLHSLNDIANFMRSEHMKTSARNQFRGRISRITLGSVNAEIELDIGADQSLVAIISKDSSEQLGFKTDHDAIALIKASSVILSSDTAIITSARNKFTGKVTLSRGCCEYGYQPGYRWR